MADRTVNVRVRATTAEYQRGMARAGQSTRQFAIDAAAAFDEQNDRLTTLGQTALGLGAVMAAPFALGTKFALDFDAQMSSVQANTNATAEEFDQLRQAALDASKSTQFSAAEVAQAEDALAKAGVDVADIMGGGLQGALALAAAGQLDLGEAAEYAASAMTTFGLAGEDIPHVADVLAAGADKSQGSVRDLALAMQQSGLVAHQMGLSLDQTVGILADFASRGLIGSDAGTSFKTMLQSLTGSSAQARTTMDQLGLSFYDASGAFVGIDSVAQQLHDHLGNLSDAQRDAALKTIFGTDAVRAATVLMEDGAQGVQHWTDAVNDSGFASQNAATKMDNLSGDLHKLGSNIQATLIDGSSGATSAMRDVVGVLDTMVTGFGNLPGPLQKTLLGVTGVTGGVLAMAGTFGIVAPKIREAKRALESLGTGGVKFSNALGKIGLALPVVGAAVALGTYLWGSYKQQQEEARQAQDELTDAILADNGALGDNTRAQVVNQLQSNGTLDAARKLGLSLEDVTDAALGDADAMHRVTSAAEDNASSMVHGTDTLRDFEWGLLGEIGTLGRAQQAADNKAAAEGDAADATRDHADAVGAAAGIIDQEAQAAQRADDALQQFRDTLDELSGKHLTADEALIRFKDDLDKLTDSLADNGATLDVNTEAGRTNLGGIIDLARAAQEHAAAILDETGSQEKANDSLRDAQEELRGVLRAAGFTEDQIDDLIDRYLQIPTSRTTKVGIDDRATPELEKLKRKLDRVTGTFYTTVRVTTIGSPSVRARPFAEGGLVRGPGGPTSDMVPARLSAGEYVLDAATVNRVGVDYLDALNAGRIRQFSAAGMMRPMPQAAPSASSQTVRLSDEDRALLRDVASRPMDGELTGRLAGPDIVIAYERSKPRVDRRR